MIRKALDDYVKALSRARDQATEIACLLASNARCGVLREEGTGVIRLSRDVPDGELHILRGNLNDPPPTRWQVLDLDGDDVVEKFRNPKKDPS